MIVNYIAITVPSTNHKYSLRLLSDQLAAHRIAALMVIFVQLCKHHLPQREDLVVSSVLPVNQKPHRFSHSANHDATRLKNKVAWPLRATTLKRQVVITRLRGKAASIKLVSNQSYQSFKLRPTLQNKLVQSRLYCTKN